MPAPFSPPQPPGPPGPGAAQFASRGQTHVAWEGSVGPPWSGHRDGTCRWADPAPGRAVAHWPSRPGPSPGPARSGPDVRGHNEPPCACPESVLSVHLTGWHHEHLHLQTGRGSEGQSDLPEATQQSGRARTPRLAPSHSTRPLAGQCKGSPLEQGDSAGLGDLEAAQGRVPVSHLPSEPGTTGELRPHHPR